MCRKRLASNVLKGFGDLDIIFSFPRTNKTKGITNIGVRKLGWMTFRGFFKVGTMSECGLEMVALETPVLDEICSPE